MTVLLTASDLARLLRFEAVIETVAHAFAAYSAGLTDTPLRVGVEPPGSEGVLLAMPSAVAPGDPFAVARGPFAVPPGDPFAVAAGTPAGGAPGDAQEAARGTASRVAASAAQSGGALGAKIVSVFPRNPARGLPTVTSVYVLSDYETGAPLAIMDGGYLTAVRTAAGSAVATRALARHDARVLGVFGTGVQARFHVETIRRVRDLARVVVAGTTPERASAFAAWVRQATGLSAEAGSPEAVAAADVVATCTTSATPVVPAGAVGDGCHVNAVGAFTPTTRELPTDLVARARLFVDTRAGALSEAGDLLLAAREGALDLAAGGVAEIGEVVLGRAPGRSAPAEVTVYKSVGAAFLDAATARLAYSLAIEDGSGRLFDFSV